MQGKTKKIAGKVLLYAVLIVLAIISFRKVLPGTTISTP